MYTTHTSLLGVVVDSNIPKQMAEALQDTSDKTTAVNSPRGIKRCHSPVVSRESPVESDFGDEGYTKPAKRTRATRITRPTITSQASPSQSSMTLSHSIPPASQSVSTNSNLTPSQSSPPRTTPTKPPPAVKALPTVRDHTTDQVGPEGDEYLPREHDDAGEKKVDLWGQLSDGREYKCRTFFVPNRGKKLFMLATECARVLGYRDSYLLFNKNRSLFKIIASQAEKEDLIHQEILPFSYRSRQIAIVSARSMFRQFGSRVIRDGRRVRDDYWEGKARKQGFTEEDLAGEKRPGAAKARDTAAAADASASASLMGPRHDILYSNNTGNAPSHISHPNFQTSIINGSGETPTLSMISLGSEPDMRLKDYSNIQRPRQEITGPAYQDRIQPSPLIDLLSCAHQTAEYNKQINSQRTQSFEYLHRRWRQPHEIPSSKVEQPSVTAREDNLPMQALPSPRTGQNGLQSSPPETSSQQAIQSQNYPHNSHMQNPMAHSPMRNIHSSSMQPGQVARSPSISMGINTAGSNNSYGYGQPGQMWSPQSQPQPQTFPHYASPSPRIQRSPHQPVPMPRHPANNAQVPQNLQYTGIPGFAQNYSTPSHGIYTADRAQQQYVQPSSSGPQANNQNWTGQQPTNMGTNWAWNGLPQ
ncbi:BgTH12-03172 [Blumeria graminis f. sp. triticale]|uniref:Bgt-3742 n=3 Tax=Blumeria graminis TaxID=34373 RepID=A0A061HGY9_BLUGR|nr:Component of the RSC chromatin remodeling complex [Blumeria graminis f. sp. tritici 96224]CAD6503510.1 BgTH12-03172 [Blumeria graminis f. sp. triticale]VDB89611.1 Bgt-3742 [Blumeria graminis f. sp. tritici]